MAAVLLLGGGLAAGLARAEAPDWAYPACPVRRVLPDDGPSETVPGSRVTLPPLRTHAAAEPPDWFPEEHSIAPRVVMHGATPAAYACGFCHLPDGHGRPENANLAGLPADYILRQLRAMRAGDRREAVDGWLPTRLMVESLGALSDADAQAAADYFAAARPRTSVEVVERAEVPAYALACFVYATEPGAPVALGERIIEVPQDRELFERRDPHAAIVAYVPVGSIDRGRQLVMEGRGGIPACVTCHGENLRGGTGASGPPLAGRYPGYLFRQLVGFRSGTRAGIDAAPMRAVVAGLSESDMIAAAAFAASQPP